MPTGQYKYQRLPSSDDCYGNEHEDDREDDRKKEVIISGFEGTEEELFERVAKEGYGTLVIIRDSCLPSSGNLAVNLIEYDAKCQYPLPSEIEIVGVTFKCGSVEGLISDIGDALKNTSVTVESGGRKNMLGAAASIDVSPCYHYRLAQVWIGSKLAKDGSKMHIPDDEQELRESLLPRDLISFS